jgi:hypothetical protein
VTAVEAYELTTQGGATDFARLAAYLHELAPESRLRIQFITDERYRIFPSRAAEAKVLGVTARVASLADVTQGKLDLIRLAEAYPELKSSYPRELQEQIERG